MYFVCTEWSGGRVLGEVTTVMILSFQTDSSRQTVHTEIKVFTVCYSICIFLTKYCKVCSLCSNFRLNTAKFCSKILGLYSSSGFFLDKR